MTFPSFASGLKRNDPLGGVTPGNLDAAKKRQQTGQAYGNGLSTAGNIAKAQDAATIATAQGDPNAPQMAADLQRQKMAGREQQLTKEAEAEARIKAKAEVAGDAVKADAEAGRVNLGAVGGGHGFTGGVEGYSGGENGNAAGISVEQMNAPNSPQRQAERDAGIFFRSQKDRRRGV